MFASVSAMPLYAALADSDWRGSRNVIRLLLGGFWESAAFSFVPRRSRMLEVPLLSEWPKVVGALLGALRFQNPLYGRFPQWQPEPLPATKMAGDVQVTLLRCSVWG